MADEETVIAIYIHIYVRAGNGISVRQFIIKSAGRIIGIKRLQKTSPVLNSHSTHGKWNLCSPTRPLFYRVPLGYYIPAPTLECKPWTMIIQQVASLHDLFTEPDSCGNESRFCVTYKVCFTHLNRNCTTPDPLSSPIQYRVWKQHNN